MENLLLFIILGVSVISTDVVIAASKGQERKHSTCHEFSQGVKFNESEVLGTWHMAVFGSPLQNNSGAGRNCVEFTNITEQERKSIAELIGKYVENLKWETLTLKMHAPCDIIPTNKTRDYYLEKVADDGSYRSFQIPLSTDKIDLAQIHRYPLKLKLIDGQYLGMMDCHEKFVFLMNRHPPQGAQGAQSTGADERLMELIDIYAPEEF